jgi:hypothetical protein
MNAARCSLLGLLLKVGNPQTDTINFIKLFKGWQPFSKLPRKAKLRAANSVFQKLLNFKQINEVI